MTNNTDLDQQEDELEQADQFLTFLLDGEEFAINILNIREILEYSPLTPVPMTPEFISGVLNLRGSVVPVINLALRFEKASSEITKRTSIVIVEITHDDQKIDIGVVVDIVNEVIEIPEIEPAPTFGTTIRTDFIEGMGKVNNGFTIILDLNHVLSVDELSLLQGTQAEGAAA
jgi:purine-binding chemotaxis protein CheW